MTPIIKTMHIQLEASDNYSIRSYDDHCVNVQDSLYDHSLIISLQTLIPSWPIQSIDQLSEITIKPILDLDPEVIIIGHQQAGLFSPMMLIPHLSKQRIGLEVMTIGAACRTFNILLSEKRKVVLGLIFSA
jgi:uncharacterized protein